MISSSIPVLCVWNAPGPVFWCCVRGGGAAGAWVSSATTNFYHASQREGIMLAFLARMLPQRVCMGANRTTGTSV